MKGFIPILIFLCSFDNGHQVRGFEYIKLSYAGDPDKPYPIVIFYTRSSIDTAYENYFTDKFGISDSQFMNIEKIFVNSFDSTNSEVLAGPVSVCIKTDIHMET